jgi:pimeloyl-ACP methyl ester carboxylesterase
MSAAPNGVELRRHMVKTSCGYVHVRTAGEGGRPLVLLHYSPGSSVAFGGVMPQLATDRLVVAPDRLGFGCSDPAPDGIDMETFARVTVDALDTLGVGEYDLVGTHTGSVEALEHATAHANRVKTLVLVSVPYFEEDEKEGMVALAPSLKPAPDSDGAHLRTRWQTMVDLSEGRYFAGTPAAWVNPDAPGCGRRPWSAEARQQFFVASLAADLPAAVQAVFSYPVKDALAAVRQPLLVLNTQDDLWRVTKKAKPVFPPHTRYQELPDLDMLAFEFAAEEMSGIIRRFLGSEGEAHAPRAKST